MKIETLVKILGILILIYAISNLGIIASSENFRESAVSLPSLIFRYSILVPAGIGMVLRRKWGAYLMAVSIVAAWVILFAVYGGVSVRPIWGSFIGPFLWAILFYKAWPKLK
jgi:hypothetical protein